MEPFRLHTGLVAPLDRANVDTDPIIPKQFLKSIKRYRFRPEPLRRVALSRPATGMDKRGGRGIRTSCSTSRATRARPSCSRAATSAAARRASTRRGRWPTSASAAVIAPSFADIFFNNCFKNGLLPIVLTDAEVDRLFAATAAFPGFTLTIDLEAQAVRSPTARFVSFDIEPFRKHCLINGLDDIGLTLQHADAIRAFEAKRLAEQPWLA